MTKSYSKLARLGVAWGALRETTNSLLVLPTSIALARLLSPEEFGIAAIAYFFLSLSTRLTQFGFNAALIRLKELKPEHSSSVFWLNLAIASLLWVAITILAPSLATFWRNPSLQDAVPVAALTFFFTAFGTVPGALLNREMKFRAAATSDWLATITNSVVAIYCAWAGYSFWSIIYGHLAADIVRSVSRMTLLRWRPRLEFSKSAIGDLFSFGAGVYTKNVLEYLSQNADNLIVGRVLGLTALGYYDKAFSVVNRMVARINIAPALSFRLFALVQEEPERFRRAYRKVMLAVTIVGYPIFIGMLLVGPELIEVLFGEKWLPSVAPFQLLCVAAMLKLLNTYASSAVQAQGRIWFDVRRQAIATTVLVVSVAAFARWGVTGAAAGVLLSAVVMTVFMQALAMRTTGFHVRDIVEPQVPAAVCCLGLAILVMTVKLTTGMLLTSPAPWLVLLASTLAGTAYYVVFLLCARFRELQSMVSETVGDFSPALAARLRGVGVLRVPAVADR